MACVLSAILILNKSGRVPNPPFTIFAKMRIAALYLCFGSWEALMDFMLESFNRPPPKPKTG